jgi:hypothetical protein
MVKFEGDRRGSLFLVIVEGLERVILGTNTITNDFT